MWLKLPDTIIETECVWGREKIRCGDVFVKENESNFVLKLVCSKWERKQHRKVDNTKQGSRLSAR